MDDIKEERYRLEHNLMYGNSLHKMQDKATNAGEFGF